MATDRSGLAGRSVLAVLLAVGTGSLLSGPPATAQQDGTLPPLEEGSIGSLSRPVPTFAPPPPQGKTVPNPDKAGAVIMTGEGGLVAGVWLTGRFGPRAVPPSCLRLLNSLPGHPIPNNLGRTCGDLPIRKVGRDAVETTAIPAVGPYPGALARPSPQHWLGTTTAPAAQTPAPSIADEQLAVAIDDNGYFTGAWKAGATRRFRVTPNCIKVLHRNRGRFLPTDVNSFCGPVLYVADIESLPDPVSLPPVPERRRTIAQASRPAVPATPRSHPDPPPVRPVRAMARPPEAPPRKPHHPSRNPVDGLGDGAMAAVHVETQSEPVVPADSASTNASVPDSPAAISLPAETALVFTADLSDTMQTVRVWLTDAASIPEPESSATVDATVAEEMVDRRAVDSPVAFEETDGTVRMAAGPQCEMVDETIQAERSTEVTPSARAAVVPTLVLVTDGASRFTGAWYSDGVEQGPLPAACTRALTALLEQPVTGDIVNACGPVWMLTDGTVIERARSVAEAETDSGRTTTEPPQP